MMPRIGRWPRRAFTAALLLTATGAWADTLPPGFVHLADLAPTIRQDMRYAGTNNFAGRPFAGYRAGACILRREAAEALVRVQARVRAAGRTLVVYDCYRPRRAVADILAWSRAEAGPDRSPSFPATSRRRLVALGYIASRSQHSAGIAVDLAMAQAGQPVFAATAGATCVDPVEKRGNDGALDFGTAYDCFDPKAATASRGLPPAVVANRKALVDAMRAEGFANYAREWWHFSFAGAGKPAAADFDVVAP